MTDRIANIGIMQGRVVPESLEQLQVFPSKWKEELSRIAQLGFGYIELLDDKENGLRNVLENNKQDFFGNLEKVGLECRSVCADQLTHHSLLQDQDTFLSKLEELIDLMGEKKGMIYVVPFLKENAPSNAEEVKRVLEILSVLDKKLRKKNAFLALEIDLPAVEIKKAWSQISPHIGLCYDLGNSIGNGYNIAREVQLLGDIILHIHVKDKEKDENVRLGAHLEQLQQGFEALREVNYKGLFTLETCITPNPIEEAATNLKTTQELYEKAYYPQIVFFAGLGSIGQRHLQNLIKLKQREIKGKKLVIIGLVRPEDKQRVIKDGNKKEVEDIGKYYNIEVVESIEEAISKSPDIVFVTNPSSLHVSTAIDFAKQGADVFIEKPLSNTAENVLELEGVLKDKRLVSQVGYQMRFHPLVETVKKIIQENHNNLLAASFEWKTFLPAHHPYEDYSIGYAARKDLGGGAVLGLIHEIDMITLLMGDVEVKSVLGGQLSDLTMDVEDTVYALLNNNQGKKNIPISLSLSYAQTKEVREWKFQFTDKTLFVDVDENTYELYDEQGKIVEKKTINIDRNELFEKEIAHFLYSVETRKQASPDVTEGKKSLKIALDMKEKLPVLSESKNYKIGIMQGRLVLPKGRGIQFFPFEEWKEEFKKAKQSHLTEIDFIFDADDYIDNPLWTEQGRNEIRNTIRDTGVKVHHVCADIFMRTPLHRGDNQAEALEILKKLLVAAKEIGAKNVEIPLVDNSSLVASSREEKAKLQEVLREALKEAHQQGITISLEADLPPQELLQLVEGVNDPFLKITYDSGNSASLGYDSYEEVKKLGKYIVNVHLKDRTLHGTTVSLGEGNADFDKLFQGLQEIQYKGNFILQAAREEDGNEQETIEKYVEFTKQYINKYLI